MKQKQCNGCIFYVDRLCNGGCKNTSYSDILTPSTQVTLSDGSVHTYYYYCISIFEICSCIWANAFRGGVDTSATGSLRIVK